MSAPLETDYLVIGAGLAGLAFADAIVAAGGDATVTLVDKRHAVGGHWLDAYPFVRLHQPSRHYGILSMPLGDDTIATHGIDAGRYQRASGAAILAHFDRVLRERLLPSRRVRFLSRTEYLGEGRLRSLASGEVTEVKVTRRLVDARFLEGGIPATSQTPFEVAEGVRVVTPNELPKVDAPSEGFVVIGAGKTAMDSVQFLLDQGVSAARIRWIRSQDVWVTNREYFHGGAFVAKVKEGVAMQLEAAAAATDIDDYMDRLHDAGYLLCLDPARRPTAYRGATCHPDEIARLREVKSVIRMGHVKRIETDRIVLEEGEVPTSKGWVHVHCAAPAIRERKPMPIFGEDRITMQYVRTLTPSFSFALIGFLEASERSDAEKNALAAPNPADPTPRGWIRSTLQSFGQGAQWRKHADLRRWLDGNRLDVMCGMAAAKHTPEGQAVSQRVRAAMATGGAGLMRLAQPAAKKAA
ncbi:MAG: NAD(P)-binding protein [Myxococcota bacterium]